MTDSTVARLDRGSTEVQDALSRTTGVWDDSRRDATARRYLLPHGEAHNRLHAKLSSVVAATAQARAAARNADLAVTDANHEYDEAHGHIARAAAGMAETQGVTDAAFRAEAAAAGIHDEAVRLAEEANAIAP